MLGVKNHRKNKKKSFFEKVRDFFSIRKMKRGILYNYWILLRNPDELQKLARGVAFGMAVSFTPFIGFHIILIGLFSLIFRASFLAGVIGSLIGNPITFPFIWIIVFWTGKSLLGGGLDTYSSKEVMESLLELKKIILEYDMSSFGFAYDEFLYPMMIGCIPYFIASYIIGYYLSFNLIESYRKKRFSKIYKGAKHIVKMVVDEVVEDVVAVEKKIEHTLEKSFHLDKKSVKKSKKKTGVSRKKSVKKVGGKKK